MPTDTIIIGAGITGITCARALQAAGLPVRLLDKGRRPGGRMATRRVTLGGAEARFDHGAQYLRPCEEGFRRALLAAGAVDWPDGSGRERLTGEPGLSALVASLAQGLEIAQQIEVSGLSWQAGRWALSTASDTIHAERLVLTVPAPQARRLLGPDDPLVKPVAAVQMSPCLTLMAGLRRGSPAPFGWRRDPSQPLAWVAQESSKPGRGAPPVIWTAQAGPDFSARYLEETPDRISARMLPMLCDLIGASASDVLHAQAHRWRYAQASQPLGRPFLKDAVRKLYLGGDWCLGARAEDGWQSGRAIAADITRKAITGADHGV